MVNREGEEKSREKSSREDRQKKNLDGMGGEMQNSAECRETNKSDSMGWAEERLWWILGSNWGTFFPKFTFLLSQGLDFPLGCSIFSGLGTCGEDSGPLGPLLIHSHSDLQRI